MKVTVNAIKKKKMHTYKHKYKHTIIFNSMYPQLMDDFSGNLIEMTFSRSA